MIFVESLLYSDFCIKITSKFFNFLKSFNFIYNYNNFILRLDFFYLLFFGKYLEYFRVFKYNEYLSTLLYSQSSLQYYKNLSKNFCRSNSFYSYKLLQQGYSVGYSYILHRNYSFLDISVDSIFRFSFFNLKRFLPFSYKNLFFFCIYLFNKLYRAYILNLVYKNFMNFPQYSIFMKLRFFSLLNLFFFLRNFDVDLNADFLLYFLKLIYRRLNSIIFVSNFRFYTNIFIAKSLSLYKIISFYIFSYISDYYYFFFRVNEKVSLDLINLKFLLY